MRNTFLVFRRDYLGYVSAWGFWVGIAALPLILIIIAAIGAFAASTTPVRYYAVVETGSVYADQIEEEFIEQRRTREEVQRQIAESLGQDVPVPDVDEDDTTERYIRVAAPGQTVDDLRPYLLGDEMIDGPEGEKPLFAAVIVPADGSDIQYWSQDVTVFDLKSKVEDAARTLAREEVFGAANIDLSILDKAREAARPVLEQRIRSAEAQAEAGGDVTLADRAPIFVSLGLSYMLWLTIFSVIQYLLMGTIEERSNKIFDSLLTSVRLPQLLAGKLLAVFAVTMTMIGAWFLLGAAITGFTQTSLPADMADGLSAGIAAGFSPSILIPALISFVFGYLLYGVVFMALGSLCDTVQEAQTLMSPMIMILMLPMVMLGIAFQDPSSPVVTYASWFPLFTPFLLILRMPHDPPMWEVLAQIGLMAVTTALILWLATKVYRAGAVHGAGVSDALDWMKRLIPGLGPKAPTAAE
ncbi:MAG: ABC transporter permease [Pseudomonadota bacterium]